MLRSLRPLSRIVDLYLPSHQKVLYNNFFQRPSNMHQQLSFYVLSKPLAYAYLFALAMRSNLIAWKCRLVTQVLLYSGESHIAQRPPIEMAGIYCNGGVWKIQLFYFYSGIWSRIIKIVFDYWYAKHPLVSHQRSLLFQCAWPSYWLFSSEINTNLWAFLTDFRFLKATPAQ